MEDGGLSNYFSFFVHQKATLSRVAMYLAVPIEGVTVYLSLLAPVGIIGRQKAQIGPRFFGQPTLGPDDVCDPDKAAGPIETGVVAAVSRTPYHLLTRNDINQQLPEDVRPYEYCLFSNTD